MKLPGRRFVVLIADGLERSDFESLMASLRAAEVKVSLAAPTTERVQSYNARGLDELITVNAKISDLQSSDFDAVILASGQTNSDTLRTDECALNFIREMHEAGKVVAAARQASSVLIDTGILKARRATACRSRKSDLVNAGAVWVEREIVVDERIVTASGSASPDEYADAIIGEVAAHVLEPA